LGHPLRNPYPASNEPGNNFSIIRYCSVGRKGGFQ
jgi:hypothetical protein